MKITIWVFLILLILIFTVHMCISVYFISIYPLNFLIEDIETETDERKEKKRNETKKIRVEYRPEV